MLVYAGTLQKITNEIGKCGKCVCAWSSLVLRGLIQWMCGYNEHFRCICLAGIFLNAAKFFVSCLFDAPVASMTGYLVNTANKLEVGCSTDRN